MSWLTDLLGLWQPEDEWRWSEPLGMWLPKPKPKDAPGERWPGSMIQPGDHIEVTSRTGFEILRDGTVNVWKDGEKRRADWKEAARIKHLAYEVIGPDLAAEAGLEPE